MIALRIKKTFVWRNFFRKLFLLVRQSMERVRPESPVFYSSFILSSFFYSNNWRHLRASSQLHPYEKIHMWEAPPGPPLYSVHAQRRRAPLDQNEKKEKLSASDLRHENPTAAFSWFEPSRQWPMPSSLIRASLRQRALNDSFDFYFVSVTTLNLNPDLCFFYPISLLLFETLTIILLLPSY